MKKIKMLLGLGLIILMAGCATQPSGSSPASSHKSHQLLADSEITAKVKSIFMDKKLFSKKDVAAISVHVETINGVVYLSGTADNQVQANNAVKLAKSVQGVSRVESSILIVKS